MNEENKEKEQSQEKFIIIDGNSLMNRAFYALPLLETKQGFFTNAVYGFVSMLIKTINEENPNYLTVVFDKAAPTFRHEEYPEYKGHREKTPEELKGQIPMAKELLKAMNISYYEKEGYEADDLIGTLCKEAEKEEDKETVIISGDKDLIQLLSDKIRLMITKKGITEFEIYDREKVQEAFGVSVDQFVDLKALMGDKSDNIPGVHGVGEKTAKKLLDEFDNLENIYDNIDKISAKKTANKLKEYSEEAFLSKKLAKIYDKAPVEINWDELDDYKLSSKELVELLKEWEMKSIIERLPVSNESDDISLAKDKTKNSSNYAVEYIYYDEEKEDSEKILENLADDLKKADKIAIYYYDEREAPPQKSIDPGEFGLSLAFVNSKCYFIPQAYVTKLIKEVIFPALPSKLVLHQTKKLWHLFYNILGEDISRKNINITDTEICGYLLDPTLAPETPRELILNYLHKEIKLARENWTGVCEWAVSLLELEPYLLDKLEGLDQLFLYEEIELPLTFVLARMEFRGIKVDWKELDRMEGELDQRIEKIKSEIFELAGEEFNLNSPKQLGEILFEKLKLPVIKKTKTGYSTSAQVLEALAGEHEICQKLLDYRQLYKIKTTYLAGLKDLICEDTGKIHTTFNQTITATGRLSSTEPNLQNIPIRLEEGRKIRKAFVASKEKYSFLACDYSQIELRILAHVSNDYNLITAFREEEDIHTQTASLIFDVNKEEVDNLMRSHAKAVNFGIAYGMSDYGLSTQLNISRKKAREYIENYFQRFPGVKDYTKKVIEQARDRGFVETLYHRKRKLPDINHKNFNRRTAAERIAINTPIQGTAADIIKKAMVEVEYRLERENLLNSSRLLLQVHDELVLEVEDSVFDKTARILKETMESVILLKVPLVADLKKGKNWYVMYGFEL